MPAWKRGDFVELNGLLAVVVGIEGDPGLPEDHSAVWFGDPKCLRTSEGGTGGARSEVWTVPTEYLTSAALPTWKH